MNIDIEIRVIKKKFQPVIFCDLRICNCKSHAILS